MKEVLQGLPGDDDGSLYYQLGRLYQDAGDAKAASKAFEKSKEIRAKLHESAHETLSPPN